VNQEAMGGGLAKIAWGLLSGRVEELGQKGGGAFCLWQKTINLKKELEVVGGCSTTPMRLQNIEYPLRRKDPRRGEGRYQKGFAQARPSDSRFKTDMLI